MTQAPTSVGAVIIGAGFGGLRMLHELRTLGVDAVIVEQAPDVGGTWYWNTYPGARTDSESWVYCYSFSESLQNEWEWPERYPTQDRVLAYLQHVADRFDLRRDIRLSTRLEKAAYDEGVVRWLITTDSGERFDARFFISATGPLSEPLPPPFPGLEDFAGSWFLTARWPQEPVDFTGKRIGVIGTGATGIQIVPELARQAQHVTVFQRTPNYAIPGRNRALTASDRADIAANYGDIWAKTRLHASGFAIDETRKTYAQLSEAERREALTVAMERGGFEYLFTTFRDLYVSEDANEAASEFLREHIRATVDDPHTAELLTPKGYPLGAKRPPVEHGYYETFNRPNVSLVDVSNDPIVEVTERGLRTRATSYDCDVLVFATGFDGSTGALMAIDVTGRGGVTLKEAWSEGPRTYLGVIADSFPNMFFVAGPQSPFGNIPVMIEHEVRWIGQAIASASRDRHSIIEPPAELTASWTDEVAASLEATLMRRGSLVHSWFLGLNVDGKPSAPLYYFGRANKYIDRLEASARGGFEGLVQTAGNAEPTAPGTGSMQSPSR